MPDSSNQPIQSDNKFDVTTRRRKTFPAGFISITEYRISRHTPLPEQILRIVSQDSCMFKPAQPGTAKPIPPIKLWVIPKRERSPWPGVSDQSTFP